MNFPKALQRFFPKYLAIILLLLCSWLPGHAQLASWNSTTLTTNPGTALAASSLGTGVSSASLSRVSLTAGTGSARYNSSGWTSTSGYLQIVVTATSGYGMNLSGKVFAFTGGSSGTGPSVLKLYWSVDNYGTAIGTINSSSSSVSTNVTLPTGSSYTNLSAVTFRIRNESTVSAGGGTVGGGGTFGPTAITVNGTASLPATAPTVASIRATSVTAASIVSGGNVTSNGNATLTGKGVAWGLATNPAATVSTAGTGTGTYVTTVSSLQPNTNYYYRAYATNSVGTSYGSNLDTTTLATVPGLLVDAGSTSPSSSIDFLIDNNDNPDGTVPGENATQYAIYENTTGAWLQASGTLGAAATWQVASAWPATITGLDPLTQYCFQVKARNADNIETALSTAACFTTQSQSGTISNVAGNNIAAFCNGTVHTLTLGYASTLATGTYTAQLSDAGGAFGIPVTIGSSTTATGVSVSIPAGTAAGVGYRIRVVNGNTVSDTTAAFIIKAVPDGTLTTGTPSICPGQETTAQLTFNASGAATGPFELSVKTLPAGITVSYPGVVSGTAFGPDATQLPAAGSTEYQLLQITAANGCMNP